MLPECDRWVPASPQFTRDLCLSQFTRELFTCSLCLLHREKGEMDPSSDQVPLAETSLAQVQGELARNQERGAGPTSRTRWGLVVTEPATSSVLPEAHKRSLFLF